MTPTSIKASRIKRIDGTGLVEAPWVRAQFAEGLTPAAGQGEDVDESAEKARRPIIKVVMPHAD